MSPAERRRTPGFFELAHLLERRHPAAARVGESGPPRRELIRFRPHLGLEFPVRDVHGADPVSPDCVSPQRWNLTATFLGLYGTESPLPTHYTTSLLDDARENDLDGEPSPARDFLDVVHHRLFSLLYRAWKKHRYHVGVTLDHEHFDRLSEHLLSLVGYGTPGLRERAGIDDLVPALRMLRYGGLLTQRPRPAAAILGIVRDSFPGVPIRLRQCVRRTLVIPARSRTHLGGRSARHDRPRAPARRLGEDSVCGTRIQDRTSRLRMVIGPLDHRRYRSWLPGSPHRRTLDELVRRAGSPHLTHEVELILRGEDVPESHLRRRADVRLGWTSWLARRLGSDRSVVFRPPHRAQTGTTLAPVTNPQEVAP